MTPFKSPGTDGIFPVLLQKGIQHLVYPLQSIYRASLLWGYIPKAWRTAQVAFIPKPGKLDYTTAKALRPISLKSFLLKGMEKLVDRYLHSGPLVNLPAACFPDWEIYWKCSPPVDGQNRTSTWLKSILSWCVLWHLGSFWQHSNEVG